MKGRESERYVANLSEMVKQYGVPKAICLTDCLGNSWGKGDRDQDIIDNVETFGKRRNIPVYQMTRDELKGWS